MLETVDFVIFSIIRKGEYIMENSNLPSLDRYIIKGLDVSQILEEYIIDLRNYGKTTGNSVELMHASFLETYVGILSSKSFIFEVEEDIKGFLKRWATINTNGFSYVLCGRIKSLFRLEEKWNGYVQEAVASYEKRSAKFKASHSIQSFIKQYMQRYRDMVAFRIIVSSKARSKEAELEDLASIANRVPDYFSSQALATVDGQVGGYTLLPASKLVDVTASSPALSSFIKKDYRVYYKDYISRPKCNGYQSLHIAMVYEKYNRPIELQMLSFPMLCHNEDHAKYETEQSEKRLALNSQNPLFSDAHERIIRQENIDLSTLNVRMFKADEKGKVIEDFAGLIKPYTLTPVTIG